MNKDALEEMKIRLVRTSPHDSFAVCELMSEIRRRQRRSTCGMNDLDQIAAEMRDYYEANKPIRWWQRRRVWNDCRADTLMIGLLAIALSSCAPSLCGKPYTPSEDRAGVEHQCATKGVGHDQ